MLRRVVGWGPYCEVKDPRPDGSLQVIKRFPFNRLVNRVLWGTWSRLPAKLRGGRPIMPTVLLADHLSSGWIPPCSIFHGWMGLSVASFQAAKRQGAMTVLENAGRHPRDWHRAGVEECQRFGINPREYSRPLPTQLVRRMEREYELCDRIVVPSKVAYRSFAESGLAEKMAIVPTGVDTEAFCPRPRPRQGDSIPCLLCGTRGTGKGGGLSPASVETPRFAQRRTCADRRGQAGDECVASNACRPKCANHGNSPTSTACGPLPGIRCICVPFRKRSVGTSAFGSNVLRAADYRQRPLGRGRLRDGWEGRVHRSGARRRQACRGYSLVLRAPR